jgi:hypothetical protein
VIRAPRRPPEGAVRVLFSPWFEAIFTYGVFEMRKAFLLLLLALLLSSCVSNDAMFLVQNLDDQSKSLALTQAGIEEYQLHVVRLQEFDQIPRIKDYFNVALRYDPSNTQAQQYLSIVDNYKNQRLVAKVKEAAKVYAKPKRTDDDNYALFVSLQTAVRIDPTNKDVRKMLADTSQDRSKLIDSYLAKAKAAVEKLDDKSTDAVKEKQYAEAFQNANKAFDIDPKSPAAQGQVSAAKAELAKSVRRRVTAIQKLIGAGNFADARTQVSALNDLNRKLDNSFVKDVTNVSYALNYSWAKKLVDQKDYATAGVKVDAALAVTRTDEAAALKRRITDLRNKADAGASFEAALQDIDRLIGDGELVAAHRKIDAVQNTMTALDKLQMLDERDAKILASLKDVYDRGVLAYRDENFKDAIDLLQTVVGIQVDYEQASDYLDKARSKQKLLDQF